MTPEDLIAHYGLQPIPREGGLFRRTWAGPERADGRPDGTAIVALLTAAPDDFSALHRLPTDEIWHFYLGDPIELLLLHPDGRDELVVLGGDVLGGQRVQTTVPGGTWMGARLRPGGEYGVYGNTMAPGFVPGDFELGDRTALGARWPHRAELITALTRPASPGNPPWTGPGSGTRRGGPSRTAGTS